MRAFSLLHHTVPDTLLLSLLHQSDGFVKAFHQPGYGIIVKRRLVHPDIVWRQLGPFLWLPQRKVCEQHLMGEHMFYALLQDNAISLQFQFAIIRLQIRFP